MTDEQLTQLTVEELKDIYSRARAERLRAAMNNQWDKHQQHGELMQKCEQLFNFKKNSIFE